MGKERKTQDITALAGARGEWRANTIETLPQPLQEMTRTIESWFDLSQGWHLTTCGDKVRIARSSKVPDLYTVRFYYDADNPPIAKDSLCPSCSSPYPGSLDLWQVLGPNLGYKHVHLWSTSGAGIRGIENIGPVERQSLWGVLVGIDYSDERWLKDWQQTHPMRLVVKVNIKTPVSTS